ncbi:MAG TPA: TIGR03560 family F420-dependent LLM class oxidoreductase [Candidatus Limnocylindrales bacterium]
MRLGAAFWIQRTGWPELRDACVAAERAGFDTLWLDDHLLADEGDWHDSKFEGWSTLAAVAAVTTRARLGLLVSANTFRNPGLTAKLATTLDHISGGRAILGIGGGWFEREHDAFGLEFGTGFGERLDRLDESVMLIRRLLDGERVTHEGRFYTFHDALCEPRPVQKRLPILIGGSGPKKTLRTTARYADAWNTSGTIDEVREKVATLEAHCRDAGRDPAAIERTVSFPIVIRDDRGAAETRFRELLDYNGAPDMGEGPVLLGSPAELAAELRPFAELGFSRLIGRLPGPYDRETIERIGEVGAALGDA